MSQKKSRRKSYAVKLAKFQEVVADDPFEVFGLKPTTRWNLIKPRARHLCECSRDTVSRSRKYDAPRIRYFRDKFRAGKRVEPLTVSIEQYDGETYVELNNGYHRFAGAVLARMDTIRIRIRSDDETLSDNQQKVLRKLAA